VKISKWIRPRRWRIEDTVTTRSVMKGNNRFVSAKRPEVIRAHMKFEVVDRAKGRRHHDAALLIKTSSSPVHSAAKAESTPSRPD